MPARCIHTGGAGAATNTLCAGIRSEARTHSQVQLVCPKNPLVTDDASTGFPLQLLHWAFCRSEHRVAVYMPTVVQSVQGEQLEPVENSLSIHCPAERRADFSYDCVATAAASPASLGCATTEKAKRRRGSSRCNTPFKSTFTCTQCRAVKPPFPSHSLVAATGLDIVSSLLLESQFGQSNCKD